MPQGGKMATGTPNSKFKSGYKEPGPVIFTIKSILMSHWLNFNHVTVSELITITTVMCALMGLV